MVAKNQAMKEYNELIDLRSDARAKDQLIKELESATLDLQSELARKKYSLSVACNRVEELEGKLKIAVDALKPLANAENKIFKNDKNRTAANALKQIGELK